MVRPQQLLHPQREPVLPRPAATVLLLRDSPQGIEVLMTRRSLTASFAPGAYVFPGGGIDALDAASHAHALRRDTQSDLHLTQAIAAIRESFEELGVLLAHRADGAPVDDSDIATLDRKALQLTGGPNSPRPPAGRGTYEWVMDQRQADVFLTYCTNAVAAQRQLPRLKVVAVPPSLQVGAAYGLTVKRDAPPAAAAFAQALLQPPAQAVFARYGFGAP